MAFTPPATSRAQLHAVEVRCPAKINLHLRVGPVRGDGFHPLLTWMCTVGLFDSLKVRTPPGWHGHVLMPVAADAASESRIRLTCNDPSLPTDERNLVVRIVQAWGETIEVAQPKDAPLPPIDATLEKRIPAGAGLGGGSSDAACALLAADLLWTGGVRPDGTSRPVKDLSAFAAGFGSDVPFFLHAPSAICTGRGEIVRAAPEPAVARWALLILPRVHLATPEVYRRFDAMGLGRTQDIEEEPNFAQWASLPAAELMEKLVNDLEPAAFDVCSDLGRLRQRAQEVVGQPVRMSGSGSSLFTLFDSADQAGWADAQCKRWLSPDEPVGFEVVELAPKIEIAIERNA